MLAAIGFVFAVIACTRALRERLFWVVGATFLVGCCHVLAFVTSFHSLRASGNPVAVLGLLVLGRIALPRATPADSVTTAASWLADHPLAANALLVLVSAVTFARLDHRMKPLHPDTAEARRLAALTNALLAVALVDGLLFAIGLLARALLRV